MDNEIVERIELKLAFLERANQELSDVVYRQQQEIELLRAQLASLRNHVATVKEPGEYSAEEERPPHY